jgi:hypothetical protein
VLSNFALIFLAESRENAYDNHCYRKRVTMAKTEVRSPRVWAIIRKLTGREPLGVVHRGSMPPRTFEVWFSSKEHERITIPAHLMDKHPEKRAAL